MKRVFLFLLTAGLLAGAYGIYLYNKPHKSMENARVDEKIDAQALYTAFEENETEANARFLGKVIQVSGRVSEVNNTPEGGTKVTLEAGDFGVSCELDPLTKHERTAFSVGETASFKGNCTGFNLDVQLARCVEVK